MLCITHGARITKTPAHHFRYLLHAQRFCLILRSEFFPNRHRRLPIFKITRFRADITHQVMFLCVLFSSSSSHYSAVSIFSSNPTKRSNVAGHALCNEKNCLLVTSNLIVLHQVTTTKTNVKSKRYNKVTVVSF